MKECAYCGHKNEDAASRCVGCGTSEFVCTTRVEEPKESHTEYYNRKRPFQWFKAAFACLGIHIALTTVLALILVVAGVADALASVIFLYLFFGWIPLAIWVYPFLLRRMQ